MDDNNISYFVTKCLKDQGKNSGKIRDFYKGTLTSDRLASDIRISFKTPFTIAFIVNTLGRSQTGIGHWLAISVQFKPNQNLVLIRFFDSFGKSYKSYNRHISSFIDRVKNLCRNHRVKFIFDEMGRGVQNIYNKVCGLYSAMFIIRTWTNRNTKSIGKMFQGFTNKNGDQKILSIMKKCTLLIYVINQKLIRV